jgi:hypothetical protein
MSVRAFTNGYDFYSPYRMVMWHEYTREYRPKHWDDHGESSKTEVKSGDRDIFSRQKTRQLFGQEDNGINIDHRYGLGDIRTLHDYEVYGGFDFKRCLIQDYTLKVKEPPNPTPWENQFNTKKYSLDCVWDLDFFKNFNFNNPKFLTLGIFDINNQEIYRKDFVEDEYINLKTNFYELELSSFSEPSKIIMYLYDEKEGWSEMYEKLFI